MLYLLSAVKFTAAVKTEAMQNLECRLLTAKHPVSMAKHTAPAKKQMFKENTCQHFTLFPKVFASWANSQCKGGQVSLLGLLTVSVKFSIALFVSMQRLNTGTEGMLQT